MILFKEYQTGFELIKKLKRMSTAEFVTPDVEILHVSKVLHSFPSQMLETIFIPGLQCSRRKNTSFGVYDDFYFTDELIGGV